MNLIFLRFNDPYLVHLRIYKFDLTVYRRGSPYVCASWAQHFPARGGHMEDWASWCLWQTKSGKKTRWHWWRRTPSSNEDFGTRFKFFW